MSDPVGPEQGLAGRKDESPELLPTFRAAMSDELASARSLICPNVRGLAPPAAPPRWQIHSSGPGRAQKAHNWRKRRRLGGAIERTKGRPLAAEAANETSSSRPQKKKRHL
jgi:hypothetical protein